MSETNYGKVFFKHTIVNSQEKVEEELNYWNDKDCIDYKILNQTVTVEKASEKIIDGLAWPVYIYHITIIYLEILNA